MQYLFVPLILVVLLVLCWSWWSARSDRDPVASVDSFNRALTAMRPGAGAPRDADDRTPPAEAEPVEAGAGDRDAFRDG